MTGSYWLVSDTNSRGHTGHLTCRLQRSWGSSLPRKGSLNWLTDEKKKCAAIDWDAAASVLRRPGSV